MPEAIRHRGVSRLEGFSDAVFGFALTLLVVSLETPKSSLELRNMIGGFLPFVLMFAMVCWIWYEHNVFFRRYGLEDAWTAFLNCALLFVVLFYVYPLKFLTNALVGNLMLGEGTFPGIDDADGLFIMFMYSSGVLLIFATFVLLHWHAWRRRTILDLSESELLTLRYSARSHIISMSVAVASILLLIALPHQPAFGGVVFAVMGPLHAWNGYRAGAAHGALKKKQLAPAEQLQRQDKAHDKPGP